MTVTKECAYHEDSCCLQ